MSGRKEKLLEKAIELIELRNLKRENRQEIAELKQQIEETRQTKETHIAIIGELILKSRDAKKRAREASDAAQEALTGLMYLAEYVTDWNLGCEGERWLPSAIGFLEKAVSLLGEEKTA